MPPAPAAPIEPAAADSTAAEPDGEAQAVDQGATTPPPPKGKKVAHRKRVTTPPADSAQTDQSQQPAQSAQQAPGAFPAPLPSGGFTR